MTNTLLLTCCLVLGSGTPDRQAVVVVVGAAGADEYGAQFQEWAQRWEDVAGRANAAIVRIGREMESDVPDREHLARALSDIATPSSEPVWIVLIGHGTFDGKVAKLNLRGPDVSADELSEWLADVQRPLAIVNCASASGPFINKLSAANRVVVTATKSGFEHNFARFGDYLSKAIGDLASDLDKDEQTSLLEAFLAAASRTQEFYDAEGRLATEHALLDDNGDGLGTPATWFHGVRATRTAKDGAPPDGPRANRLCLIRSDREQSMPLAVRQKRDALEREIAVLRERKETMAEDEYYNQLELLLLELATLYEQLESQRAGAKASSDPTPKAASPPTSISPHED